MGNISETANSLVETGYQQIDLNDMAERSSGAWPKGWYPAEVIEGFEKGGHQFDTANTVSNDGQSFNLRLCFRLANGPQIRTDFCQLNYRPTDFTPERVAVVKRLREEFKDVQGAWPGFKDEQRSSLALAKLGQLGKAAGIPLDVNVETGGITPIPFLGKRMFVFVDINEDGYNEIKRFSAFANGVEPKARTPRRARSTQ